MNYDELDVKDYGDVVCPEYSGNICHTLKQKEKALVDENMELKNELKVYKKALEIACEYHHNEMKFDDKAIITVNDIKSFLLERAKL